MVNVSFGQCARISMFNNIATASFLLPYHLKICCMIATHLIFQSVSVCILNLIPVLPPLTQPAAPSKERFCITVRYDLIIAPGLECLSTNTLTSAPHHSRPVLLPHRHYHCQTQCAQQKTPPHPPPPPHAIKVSTLE